ncbi:hypothetical protein ACUN7V_18100 [Quadrisphaera oryzae]|uniref:hypothetical protein n=1 Tax=Quadrisphaera TaxID=317661 RepID=UPI0016447BF3|nr:hypothetical protein [Quadrisphaera sp. RL12-1S]MBC3760939.1 hypothetical protein [Quadrisphaera sp. RL12-1S]
MTRDGATTPPGDGRAEYGDVLALLDRAGLDASLTHDGDELRAIEVVLDDGQALVITEVDGCLAPRREEHRSWGVSLYPVGAERGEPVAWDGVPDDGSPEALMPLVSGVLLDTMRGPTPPLR